MPLRQIDAFPLKLSSPMEPELSVVRKVLSLSSGGYLALSTSNAFLSVPAIRNDPE